ncbi:MAG: hypothetical protein C0490_22640, partial [Marivirga sp.]|nr:hypothetical protein [Marivirga sp.]
KTPGKSTPVINTSFDGALVLQGSVTALNGNSGTGSISMTVLGGTPPYVYSWNSGEQTTSIGNKPQGFYNISVSDAVGRVQNRTYALGYTVDWINKIGVTASGSTLYKMPLSSGWTNAGAVSSNLLQADTDGWVEFSVANGSEFIVGLASNNTISNTGFSNGIFIDYATSSAATYEGSVYTNLGNCQTGDVFRISREGNLVKYFRNGLALRTTTVNPSTVLKVKATIKVSGKNTPNITTSFWSTDGISKTYYSIRNGSWSDPGTWSLAAGGSPSAIYPSDIDKVIINGHSITISGSTSIAGITINATGDDSGLAVEGSSAVLTVKGNIIINRENGSGTGDVLSVNNNARLEIKNP